jgi:hypothetical protein
MYAVGYILYLAGLIAWAIGGNMFLAVVFRYSTAWFFSCMFVPFANWIYFFLYIEQTWKQMLIGAAGFVAAITGCWIMAVSRE